MIKWTDEDHCPCPPPPPDNESQQNLENTKITYSYIIEEDEVRIDEDHLKSILEQRMRVQSLHNDSS